MNILLVSATDFEIAPVVRDMDLISQENDSFYRYNFRNHSIDVLVTGIGIPFTIYQLSTVLFDKQYDFVLNAGIAGSFHASIKLGTVVQVISERFADIGIEEKDSFKSIFEIQLHNKDQYPFTNGIIVNNNRLPDILSSLVLPVSAITVNKVSGSIDTIRFFRDTYNPDIESMEGAAFFYVCMMEKIRFFQIRSISNFIEERDTTKWEIRLAVTNLNQYLKEIFENIPILY